MARQCWARFKNRASCESSVSCSPGGSGNSFSVSCRIENKNVKRKKEGDPKIPLESQTHIPDCGALFYKMKEECTFVHMQNILKPCKLVLLFLFKFEKQVSKNREC
jgi:hypothetical protein